MCGNFPARAADRQPGHTLWGNGGVGGVGRRGSLPHRCSLLTPMSRMIDVGESGGLRLRDWQAWETTVVGWGSLNSFRTTRSHQSLL
eukprot:superscaffoldBa00000435_g4709